MRYGVVLSILVLVGQLAAQTDRAALTGTISDQSQSIVPNATITLTAQATGLQYSAVTNGVGAYTISSLPVGDYTGAITASGFEPLHVETFTLNVGQTRTLNAMMQVGSVTSQVKVVAATPDLDQVTSEVGGVIQGPQTESLPVNGRYWASLMVLIPGAISSGTGTQDTIRFSGLPRRTTTSALTAWTPPV